MGPYDQKMENSSMLQKDKRWQTNSSMSKNGLTNSSEVKYSLFFCLLKENNPSGMPRSMADEFLQNERRSWADQFEQFEGNETEEEWLKKWEKEQEELKGLWLAMPSLTIKIGHLLI